MRDPRLQKTFDVAVVMPTMLGSHLGRAVRSIYAQDIDGRVQVLIGIDSPEGDAAQLESLKRDCPANMVLSILDLGYSTTQHRGGLYGIRAGGVLRTMLSYAANSPRIAYLDDDNWWAPTHLSDLLGVIDGFDWAFSLRWYVDPDTDKPFAVDRWESVGPGKGLYAREHGGFSDTNTLMIDKIACHRVLPAWSETYMGHNRGEDRSVFRDLVRHHSVAWTGNPTAYYVYRDRDRAQIKRLVESI